MGACFSERHVACDSEVESLIRETLNSYNLLTKKNLKTITREFYNIPKIEKKDENSQEQTYNSNNYEQFLAKFQTRNSVYEQLQKCIPQDFDELFESHLHEKPEYNFLLFAIGFLDEGNKFGRVREIYSYTDKDPETFTYEEFGIFLDDYITEALVNITRRFNKYIQSLNKNHVLPQHRVATENLKNESARVLEFYENKDNHTRIRSDILRELRRILKLEAKEYEAIKSQVLQVRDIEKLNSVFPDFFNVIEFRHYYWIRFDYYKASNRQE